MRCPLQTVMLGADKSMAAGLLPGLAQVVPSAAISFWVFEQTKALLHVRVLLLLSCQHACLRGAACRRMHPDRLEEQKCKRNWERERGREGASLVAWLCEASMEECMWSVVGGWVVRLHNLMGHTCSADCGSQATHWKLIQPYSFTGRQQLVAAWS